MVAGSRSTPSSVVTIASVGASPLVSTWWTESSRSSGSMPSEKVRHACGSRSTSSTRWPSSASAAPIEATVVVLATPPFWLAIARTVVRRWLMSVPIMPDAPGRDWYPTCETATHVGDRTRHRPHGRHRPLVRPAARRARLRPGPGRPRRGAAGEDRRRAARGPRRGGRGAVRRPDRPGRPGPRRGPARRRRPPGRPAGQQRRLRAQGQVPRQRRRRRDRDARRPGHRRAPALPRRAQGDGRARPRRHHQRLQRGGVPAPRHLQRREGLGELVLGVGRQRVQATAASR